MFRKRTLISTVLLIGTLLLPIGRTEGVAFKRKVPQNFYSSKLALQTGKCTLSNNDLGYSMRHAVLASSVEWKHKTTSRSISQGCIGMTGTIYMTELLSGLVGAYLGSMTGVAIGGVPMSETSQFLIYYPMTALGAATGTSFVGLCLNQKGTFTGALIGSALGVSTALLCKDILPPLSLCPCASIGAVLGYNYVLGRPGTKPWRQ